MSVIRFGGLAIFATMLVQAGGGEPVSTLTIPSHELEEASQPDFDRFVSEMHEASTLWTQGDKARASQDMSRTLADYSNILRARYPERGLTPVEQDVLDIRNAVRDPKNFKALGIKPGPPYRAAVLDPSVTVTLSNRSTGIVTIRRPLANRPWTLYLSEQQTEQLASTLGPVTGSGTTTAELWRQFLGVSERHSVVAWSIRAHPAVYSVRFLNTRRTLAEVSVLTSDFTGLVALFEKNSDQWILLTVTRQWIA